MATSAVASNESIQKARYPLLMHSAELTGIDYVKTDFADQKHPKLYVYFIPKSIAQSSLPKNLTEANIQLTQLESNGQRILPVTKLIYPKAQDPENLLIVELQPDQLIRNANAYILELSDVNAEKNQLGIDVFFNQVKFLASNISAKVDCLSTNVLPLAKTTALEIDYLAKDYLSFRQLMINRLSVLAPQWQFDNPADATIVIIEALAYAADQLSYYQDAVATEAYIGTARRRVSVKRHARLLDYRMHEGCNARVWVQIKIKDNSKAAELEIPKGTQLITRLANTQQSQPATSESLIFFETMYLFKAVPQHNTFYIYGWGAKQFVLAKGVTSATLKRFEEQPSTLKPGMVLIIEDPNSVLTSRHAIRLIEVVDAKDPINKEIITHIKWHAQDALPADVSVTIYDEKKASIVMSGNIVLADQGRSIKEPIEPDRLIGQTSYQSVFHGHDLTFRMPFDPENMEKQSASAALYQNVHKAYTVDTTLRLSLFDKEETWYAKPDLLNSRSNDPHFVIEIENDRQAFIRFGDGMYGKQPAPNSHFQADYRVGNGKQGNVGAEAITEILDRELDAKLAANVTVRNPLPAQGGTEPESMEEVRLYAPKIFKIQQRGVTLQDYVTIMERHTKVKKAAVIQRWTGSWNTIFIAVDTYQRLPLDAATKMELEEFVKPYQVLGQEISIIAPQFVPLDIGLDIHLKPGYDSTAVKRDLLERFSDHVLPDGQRGFFHPDNFSFDNSVYLSQIINVALAVPGVDWINWIDSDDPTLHTWFRVLGSDSTEALQEGVIEISGIQIAQLENDPLQRNKGIIQFNMETS